MSKIQRKDLQFQYCRTDMKLNNMEIQLYNNLPSDLKNLKNIHLFRRKVKPFLLQHTFHSVAEYLSYELLLYKV
jgi:hypothetical protein